MRRLSRICKGIEEKEGFKRMSKDKKNLLANGLTISEQLLAGTTSGVIAKESKKAKAIKTASNNKKRSSVCKNQTPETVNSTSTKKKTAYKKTTSGEDTASRYTITIKEPKTKRINLVARPTLFEDFKKATAKNGQSVNDAINELMELYVNKNGNIHNI